MGKGQTGVSLRKEDAEKFEAELKKHKKELEKLGITSLSKFVTVCANYGIEDFLKIIEASNKPHKKTTETPQEQAHQP